MSVFPFGSVVEVRPVLVGVTNYAVWGSVFRDFDGSIGLYALSVVVLGIVPSFFIGRLMVFHLGRLVLWLGGMD